MNAGREVWLAGMQVRVAIQTLGSVWGGMRAGSEVSPLPPGGWRHGPAPVQEGAPRSPGVSARDGAQGAGPVQRRESFPGVVGWVPFPYTSRCLLPVSLSSTMGQHVPIQVLLTAVVSPQV